MAEFAEFCAQYFGNLLSPTIDTADQYLDFIHRMIPLRMFASY
jgi:hypothetical protein